MISICSWLIMLLSWKHLTHSIESAHVYLMGLNKLTFFPRTGSSQLPVSQLADRGSDNLHLLGNLIVSNTKIIQPTADIFIRTISTSRSVLQFDLNLPRCYEVWRWYLILEWQIYLKQKLSDWVAELTMICQ